MDKTKVEIIKEKKKEWLISEVPEHEEEPDHYAGHDHYDHIGDWYERWNEH